MVFKITKYISVDFWTVANCQLIHWKLFKFHSNWIIDESFKRVLWGLFLQVQKPAFTGLSLTVRYGKPTPATPEKDRESEGGTERRLGNIVNEKKIWVTLKSKDISGYWCFFWVLYTTCFTSVDFSAILNHRRLARAFSVRLSPK